MVQAPGALGALLLGAYIWSLFCRAAATFSSVAAGAVGGAAATSGLALLDEGQPGVVVDGGEEDPLPLRW